jgi:hypothetical protein
MRSPAGSQPGYRRSRGLPLPAMRDELLAAMDVKLLVVWYLLEFAADHLIELVLDRYTESDLQRAPRVFAARNFLRLAIDLDFDERVPALVGLVRRFIHRFHISPTQWRVSFSVAINCDFAIKIRIATPGVNC